MVTSYQTAFCVVERGEGLPSFWNGNDFSPPVDFHLEERIKQSGTQTAPVSKKRLWVGRILSALPVLMLLFSGVLKLIKPTSVVEEFARLGYPESRVLWIGLLELACTVAYVIPRTSIIGAILLTAYLGGATATHVRVGDPFLIPIVLGGLVWGGLLLRDERLHALLPLRR